MHLYLCILFNDSFSLTVLYSVTLCSKPVGHFCKQYLAMKNAASERHTFWFNFAILLVFENVWRSGVVVRHWT